MSKHMTDGERKHARRLINACLASECSLSLWDGEAWAVKRSTDGKAILAEMAATDEDLLRARDKHGTILASFRLIYGNAQNGEELIADYTDNEFGNAIYASVAKEER